MRVALVITSLAVGGAQFATIRLANEFAGKGHETTLIVFTNDLKLRPEIHSSVRLVSFDHRRSLRALWSLMKAMRKEPNQAYIFSTVDAALIGLSASLLSGARLKKMVVWEHSLLPRHSSRLMLWFRRIALALLYPRASCLVFPSQYTKLQFEVLPGLDRLKMKVLPNPLQTGVTITDAHAGTYLPSQRNQVRLMAVGRLVVDKDFITYLHCIAELRNRGHNVDWRLYGDGPELSNLLRIASDLEFDDAQSRIIRDSLTPFKDEFHPDVLVVTSISESASLVVVEAMAQGIQIVATRCGGPEEILQHGSLGWLVPIQSPESAASAVEQAIRHRVPRQRLLREAARYDPGAVAQQWLSLLQES